MLVKRATSSSQDAIAQLFPPFRHLERRDPYRPAVIPVFQEIPRLKPQIFSHIIKGDEKWRGAVPVERATSSSQPSDTNGESSPRARFLIWKSGAAIVSAFFELL